MSSLFDLLAPISSILPLLVIAFFGLVLMVVEAIWRDHTEPALWSWLILLMGLVAGVFLFVNGPAGPVPEAVRSYLAADRMAYFFDIVISENEKAHRGESPGGPNPLEHAGAPGQPPGPRQHTTAVVVCIPPVSPIAFCLSRRNRVQYSETVHQTV